MTSNSLCRAAGVEPGPFDYTKVAPRRRVKIAMMPAVKARWQKFRGGPVEKDWRYIVKGEVHLWPEGEADRMVVDDGDESSDDDY